MNDNELKVLSEYRYYLSNIYNLFSLSKLMQYTSTSSYTSVIYWLNDIWLGHSRQLRRVAHIRSHYVRVNQYICLLFRNESPSFVYSTYSHTHSHTYTGIHTDSQWIIKNDANDRFRMLIMSPTSIQSESILYYILASDYSFSA